ncbi:MAG: hypothetical protein HY699_22715 [Deltaproteobacteria bacterium]|nr:hypothetical protein [Deltaproteobacteria bacterium]
MHIRLQRLARVWLFALVSLGNGCGGTVEETQPLDSAAVLQRGPNAVGVTTVEFVDTSRPTMPNGSYEGAPTRTLVTEIWYPATPDADVDDETRDAAFLPGGQRYPLIVYSHGFMGTRAGETYIVQQLASYGYIVASADYPLTNFNAPERPNGADVVNQPADVKFLIDQLLALDSAPSGLLARHIDHDRIGLAGLSLGGLTTYLAAFHPTLRDPRVRAVAAIAGPGCFFTPAFFGDRRVPLMIVHGDIDAIVPYQQSAPAVFAGANAPKYLATITGGSHTGFAGVASILFGGLHNPDSVGCAQLGRPSTGGNNEELLRQLGGAEAGLVRGDCPPACAPGPQPKAIEPARQHELALLTLVPFFEAYLRDSRRHRQFLEDALAGENPELSVEYQL